MPLQLESRETLHRASQPDTNRTVVGQRQQLAQATGMSPWLLEQRPYTEKLKILPS